MSPIATGLGDLRSRLHRPVDAGSLAVFRIGFGAILLWSVWRTFALGRIREYYLDPAYHFTYHGFEWVRPWPGLGMYVHFLGLGVCALLIALGKWYRVSCALFTLGFGYVFLIEQGRYLNHHYLVFLLALLMTLVPAHRALALDARKHGWSGVVPAWSVHLVRTQVGLVYLFAGIAKLNPDWLRGQPLRLWLPEHADHPVLGTLLTQEWVALVASHGSMLLDLLAWGLLLCPATRLPAFFLVSAFHLTNSTLFGIGIFPWMMIVASTLFFPPAWPRRWLPALRREPIDVMGPGGTPGPGLPRRAVEVFLVAYLGFQFLFPLRHFLFPGRVSWTEEGHRFAWHMLLRDKHAETVFNVRDPVSGELWLVDPKDELVSWQARKMAGNPDMIHAYALELADRMRPPGSTVDLEVRVEAWCSLNGRPRQRLIDPSVDLARSRRSFRHSPWILPLE